VFGTGGGTDTIRDFEDRTDLIEIESGASRYSSLQIRQWGDDVRVQFGTVTIFIENTDRGDISAADFLFT
jgi:hypothetical protein